MPLQMPFSRPREQKSGPIPSNVGKERRGELAWLTMCHHSPYGIRPMWPRRDRHHSPLTRFVPASEVTIHKRWYRRLCGHRLGSHDDLRRRHLYTRRVGGFLQTLPEKGVSFRRAARGLRTRAAPLALQAPPTGASYWALGLT